MRWENFPQLKLFRTLRFRLASTFLALLGIVLVVVGIVGTKTLESVLETRNEQVLNEELSAMRGYLHFDQGLPYWYEDPSDPEEEAAVGRLKSVFVVTDDEGKAWQGSDPPFEGLYDRNTILAEMKQIERTKQPAIKTITGNNVHYQVISSVMMDADHNGRWYVALGRSLADDEIVVRRFRRNFLIFLTVALLACAVVSWYSAGKALRALTAVERAAQDITGSSLGVQIAKRGADDELDRLIDSFNKMSRRLKLSFDQIRQFSTDVSHELRTPLTAIQGQLEVALFTGTQKEHLREAIENALQDVERLSNLVRALLLLSQSETGQLPMNKAQVDLSAMVADLVEQFQIPAEAQDVRLTFKGGPSVTCEVDRTQMERVITNLLSNALKYTPAGGRIQAWVEPTDDHARIVVEDSGIGIPQ